MTRRRHRHINTLHSLLAAIAAACMGMVCACSIEPPLKIATVSNAYITLGEIITDLEIVWEIDSTWRQRWWYGWDEIDRVHWGELEYPIPSTYEARFLHHGEDAQEQGWLATYGTTLYETTFQRAFDYGYHTMLSWSNINTPDGSQVVRIDETDLNNIFAYTSKANLSYVTPSMRVKDVVNNPEVFYGCNLDHFYIPRDTAQYDYYDAGRNAWIKRYSCLFRPLVYIYLVQVVIYNNNGRIVGITDDAAINSLANGVTINSGHTSNTPVTVTYPMRMKTGLPARDGRMADIIGGKVQTFGLCDMDSWVYSRGPMYAGSRTDLDNHLSVSLQFSNSADSAYHFIITPQMRTQSHGGIITIEIDADTLLIPNPGHQGGTGAGFDPVIVPQDTITHEFEM